MGLETKSLNWEKGLNQDQGKEDTKFNVVSNQSTGFMMGCFTCNIWSLETWKKKIIPSLLKTKAKLFNL